MLSNTNIMNLNLVFIPRDTKYFPDNLVNQARNLLNSTVNILTSYDSKIHLKASQLKRESKWEEALVCYLAVLKFYNARTKKDEKKIKYCLNSIAECYTELDNYTKAYEFFGKALQYDNNDYWTLYHMGVVYHRNREYVAADKSFKRSLECLEADLEISDRDGKIEHIRRVIQENLIFIH